MRRESRKYAICRLITLNCTILSFRMAGVENNYYARVQRARAAHIKITTTSDIRAIRTRRVQCVYGLLTDVSIVDC
jgi:hypothetical protein